MIFSLSGVAYLILFFALLFLSFRFFQYWNRKKDIFSKLFIFIVLPYAIFALFRAVSIFFLLYNTQILASSMAFVAFLESLSAAVVGYMVVYLKFPKISPWLGFAIIMFFGLLVTSLTFFVQYEPIFEGERLLSWGLSYSGLGSIYSILRMLIIFITFIPLLFIFFQQFKHSEDAFIKRRSIGMILVFLLAIALGFIDFILDDILEAGSGIYRDYIMIIISCFIFFVIFLTQKPVNSKFQNL